MWYEDNTADGKIIIPAADAERRALIGVYNARGVVILWDELSGLGRDNTAIMRMVRTRQSIAADADNLNITVMPPAEYAPRWQAGPFLVAAHDAQSQAQRLQQTHNSSTARAISGVQQELRGLSDTMNEIIENSDKPDLVKDAFQSMIADWNSGDHLVALPPLTRTGTATVSGSLTIEFSVEVPFEDIDPAKVEEYVSDRIQGMTAGELGVNSWEEPIDTEVDEIEYEYDL